MVPGPRVRVPKGGNGELMFRRPLSPVAEWRRRVAFCVVVGFHSVLVGYSACRHSPTIDEPGHLVAGLSHWQLGRFELYAVNPPLVRMWAALPVHLLGPTTDWSGLQGARNLRETFDLAGQFLWANPAGWFRYFVVARWACLPFTILGAYVCWRWAQELYGAECGLFAASLWCFCPNILANAPLIQPDLGAAAVGLAACYLFWRWLKRPGLGTAAAAGIVLGLAELTKFTWLILLPVWPVVWILGYVLSPAAPPCRHGVRQAAELVGMLLVGLLVLNLGYGFQGSFRKLGEFRFVSHALGSAEHNRFAKSWLGGVPVPLPADYVAGIDIQKRHFEGGWRSYLRGQWRPVGWWYFYVYALAIKVPLGTWGLVALALLARLLPPRRCEDWYDAAALLVPAGVLLDFVSYHTGFTHHLRYGLGVLPFLYIWTIRVALSIAAKHSRLAPPAVALLTCSMASSLRVYPHSMAYFNALGGGPTRGHAHLLMSNIDYGEDLFELQRWVDEHPEARPLFLAYFGSVDPRLAGIEFALPPRDAPQPGYYAISVNFLRGLKYEAPDGKGGFQVIGDQYYEALFRRLKPIAMAGYSIYIYHLTPDEAARIVSGRRASRHAAGADETRASQRAGSMRH